MRGQNAHGTMQPDVSALADGVMPQGEVMQVSDQQQSYLEGITATKTAQTIPSIFGGSTRGSLPLHIVMPKLFLKRLTLISHIDRLCQKVYSMI